MCPCSLFYGYNADGELTDVSGNGYYVSYSYDANGNTLSVSGSQQATYTWDLEGHMIGASVTTNGVTQTASYQYDDAGNLVSETVGDQTTTYLNDPNQAYDQVLEEYTGGMLAATYVRGLDLIFQDRSGVQSYYAVDQLGSTRALTNSSGAVTDTYTYDAYGNLIGSTGTTTNEFFYAGYQADAATGLDYLRARYYNAVGGQFTSRDTYEGDPANPLTLNHYQYAQANPVNNFDPTGHTTMDEGTAAHIIISALYQFDHPADLVDFNIKPYSGGLSRKPDIINYTGLGLIPANAKVGLVGEIKSLGEMAQGEKDLQTNLVEMNAARVANQAWVPDSFWNPSIKVFWLGAVAPQYANTFGLILGNFNGVIVYKTFDINSPPPEPVPVPLPLAEKISREVVDEIDDNIPLFDPLISYALLRQTVLASAAVATSLLLVRAAAPAIGAYVELGSSTVTLAAAF